MVSESSKNHYEKVKLTNEIKDRANNFLRELFDTDTVKYERGAVYRKPRKFVNLRSFVRVHTPKENITDQTIDSAFQEAEAKIKALQAKLLKIGIRSTISAPMLETHASEDDQGQMQSHFFNVITLLIDPNNQEGGIAGFLQRIEEAVFNKRMKDFLKTGDSNFDDIEKQTRQEIRAYLSNSRGAQR